MVKIAVLNRQKIQDRIVCSGQPLLVMIEHMFMFRMVQKSEIRVKTKALGLTPSLSPCKLFFVQGMSMEFISDKDIFVSQQNFTLLRLT